LDYKEFDKLYQAAGVSSLIDLSLDGKDSGKILIHDVQYDPVKDRIIHADLRLIDMNKPLTAMVELHFVGESPAVKAEGGTLVRTIQKVEVKCLPKDLVSNIEVDVSVLKTFHDVVKVKDLKLPVGITILGFNPEDVVVTATPALTEEQIKAMEEAGKQLDVTKIEMSGKKKEEETLSGEEGAAAGAGEKKPEEKTEEKK
jgi:large subunit ribosomal protein L25